MSDAMTPAQFATKWAGSTRTEKAASQEHFIDLCRMVGAPTPNSDPSGVNYAFDKGVTTTGGGEGFADVWRRGRFAWEYKGKKKNLDDAYTQLLRYRDALENPPILVVCDLNRFVIRTNFTNTPTVVHEFTLDDVLASLAERLRERGDELCARRAISEPLSRRRRARAWPLRRDGRNLSAST
jgi:hypothetical protein